MQSISIDSTVTNSKEKLMLDIEAVGNIDAVPSILEIICRTTGMGFAAVARVTEANWIAYAVKDEINFGLKPGGELKLETTICHEIRNSHEPVVIDHVDKDEHYKNHHTPLLYGFQSYISVPLFLKDGSFFGTLCAIDPNPAVINTPAIRGMFKLFAELIAFHLNALDQLAYKEKILVEERRISELRDQFIAILGHDLRNPVGAISMASDLLLKMGLTVEATKLSNMIKDSSFRVRGLIENVLDFARGKLGDGITVKAKATDPAQLEHALMQVVYELRIVMPNRDIITEFEIKEPVFCDDERLAQLLSNLLSNALTHGRKDTPVYLKATTESGVFTLSICNAGNKISDAVREHLFKPFYRDKVEANKQGLGLGLYIASEIARAHGGKLSVDSTDERTCFSFVLVGANDVGNI